MAIIGQNVAAWFRGQPYVSGVVLAVVLAGPLFLAASIPTWVALSVCIVLSIPLTWGACQCYRIFEQPETRPTPIERLRDRYAAGEIDETEFEVRLERLLWTLPEDLGETNPAEPIDERDYELTVD